MQQETTNLTLRADYQETGAKTDQQAFELLAYVFS